MIKDPSVGDESSVPGAWLAGLVAMVLIAMIWVPFPAEAFPPLVYDSYEVDEEIRNYPYLPDSGSAHLHAWVFGIARGFYNDESPYQLLNCYWVDFQHSDKDSYAEPTPPYDTTFEYGRFGEYPRDGGYAWVNLTFYGTTIYQPAYAELGDAFDYCPAYHPNPPPPW